MLIESESLMRLLRGERVAKPPFWEVWFGRLEYFRARYGDFEKIENRIRMAIDLGMAAVRLKGMDLNVSFARTHPASDGTEHYAGGTLVSLEQLDERPWPDPTADIERMVRDQHRINKAGLVSWLTLPWCFHATATAMGLENFALKVHDDLDFVDRAFEWIERRNRQVIDAVVKNVRPDFVLFDGDCAYKSGLMIHPSLFRQLVFERTRETVSRLKHLGIPYTFHTDGKLDEVIPLLVELGFSAVHGCEKVANDLNHLVDAFGDEIVLVGNMDVVFLSRATPQDVRRKTYEMLRIGSRKGKFIAACNTSPKDYIPDENYSAMVETIELFCKE